MLKLPMKRSNILIIFLILNILSPSANANHPTNHTLQGSNGGCAYLVQIETSCAPSAETTDHISVRFSDGAGNLIIVKHLKNPKLLYAPKVGLSRHGGSYAGFGRCAVEVYQAKGACMNQRVCSLYLKRVGSDGWRPGWVKVLNQQARRFMPVSYVFYFRTFVPANVWYGFDYCKSRGGSAPHVMSLDEKD